MVLLLETTSSFSVAFVPSVLKSLKLLKHMLMQLLYELSLLQLNEKLLHDIWEEIS